MKSPLTCNQRSYCISLSTRINPPRADSMSQFPPAAEPRDFRQEVTNRIVQLLEEGVAPWQKPWAGARVPMPISQATGKPYRGGNALLLLMVGMERGYGDPRWMTYRQASNHGWQVRRGEKGTPVEFWEFKDEDKDDGARDTPKLGDADSGERTRRQVIHRVYTVFNGRQIDGIPPFPVPERQPVDVIEAGERILSHSGAVISHDQANAAFYRPTTDTIHLPKRDQFRDAAGYYGTALHELAHWTGHSSRLNRITLTDAYRFGDMNYAKEELRAELASLFLAAERGIPHSPEDHAAYVASWVKSLKDDKHEIFRAAHDASAATDYLLALERSKDVPQEGHGYRVREATAPYRYR